MTVCLERQVFVLRLQVSGKFPPSSHGLFLPVIQEIPSYVPSRRGPPSPQTMGSLRLHGDMESAVKGESKNGEECLSLCSP